mmetsp:Transcript_18127/g.59200  ORF Transcript_18127/g.59200 Transcript_18127/m.59200 type:complete len:251 (-) Transcript_18127:2499-3251(-)
MTVTSSAGLSAGTRLATVAKRATNGHSPLAASGLCRDRWAFHFEALRTVTLRYTRASPSYRLRRIFNTCTRRLPSTPTAISWCFARCCSQIFSNSIPRRKCSPARLCAKTSCASLIRGTQPLIVVQGAGSTESCLPSPTTPLKCCRSSSSPSSTNRRRCLTLTRRSTGHSWKNIASYERRRKRRSITWRWPPLSQRAERLNRRSNMRAVGTPWKMALSLSCVAWQQRLGFMPVTWLPFSKRQREPATPRA